MASQMVSRFDGELNTDIIAPGIGAAKARPLMCGANAAETTGLGVEPKRTKINFSMS